MWLMTGFGILMPAVRPPKTVKFGDDRTMQIRARRAKDLDILRAQYMPGKLGPTLATPDKDYEFRAYCTPEAFALAAVKMITEIDYLKFKPVTEDRYGDRPLHDCYNSIWSVVMHELSTTVHRREYWGKFAPPKGSMKAETGWPEYETVVVAGSGATHRGGNADRDEYLPETWEMPSLPTCGDAGIDALFVEIDDLERTLVDPVVDHKYCQHGPSLKDELRCRTKRVTAWKARLEECRQMVDEYYVSIGIDSTSDIAESRQSVTVVEGGDSKH